jgi:hypothetical protein
VVPLDDALDDAAIRDHESTIPEGVAALSVVDEVFFSSSSSSLPLGQNIRFLSLSTIRSRSIRDH